MACCQVFLIAVIAIELGIRGEALLSKFQSFGRHSASQIRVYHGPQGSEGTSGMSTEVVSASPVLLPGKSQGWRSQVGCSLWGR